MHEVTLGDGQFERKGQVEYKEVNYGSNSRAFIGDVEFDGHHVLWGFEYFPTTYLKSSGLSGDEWRKGGEIRYFKDRKQVFSEFCRTPESAAMRIGKTLQQLQDFDWHQIEVGTKVWFERTAAIVDRFIDGQGCVILKTEDGSDFPDAIWRDKEDDMGERGSSVKVDILDAHIFWYRR